MWNCEWWSLHDEAKALPRQEEERVSNRLKGAKEIDFERERRRVKWEEVARSIKYTAMDRQVYFLLDLGAKLSDLDGIDKTRASEIIDELLSRAE